MPLGIYISVPFCRTKCSYCNFASDVFSRARFEGYVDRVCSDIERAPHIAAEFGGEIGREVDSIYLGGGTPTVLNPTQLEQIFIAVRQHFDLSLQAEVTVECAPGTLKDDLVATLLRCGVNRVSLGVQSFVDEESAAVGRLHNREIVREDVARLRDAGISNVNVDLIAGLPHQTAESWEFSLEQAIASGIPHMSVYMLEVDEDSRLGRELIAGGTRYHAHFVPDEEAVADFYLASCRTLQAHGINQYEISNFAREGFQSRHNLKYWTRQPYLGFGVDAHSMLLSSAPGADAIRFSFPDSLEEYAGGNGPQSSLVLRQAAVEESFFLGLRLTCGVDLKEITRRFGTSAVENRHSSIASLLEDGLLERRGDFLRLTERGRLFSNEVFQHFISSADAVV
jgi:oxygen-independent coproporphyrinogen III oxidase